MHKFLENFKPSYGVFSSALGAETNDKVESSFVDMKYYDGVVAYVQASGVASAKVITLTILEGKSTAGSSSATTSKTDTFTSTATSDTDLLQAEIRAEELSSGYRYVGIRVATNQTDGTEKVAGVLVQGRARYGQASLP